MAAANEGPNPTELETLLQKKTSAGDRDKIVINILSRLPVKTLLICKSISKSWLSIISSRDFIKTHLRRSINNPYFTHHRLLICDAPFLPQTFRPYVDFTVRQENLRLGCCPIDLLMFPQQQTKIEEDLDNSKQIEKDLDNCKLIEEDLDNSKQIELHYPMEDLDNWTYVVDCCNGLVCLACFDGSVYLWNPSTRNYTILPKDEHDHEHTVFGFGYDESKDDFKVYAIIGDSVSVYGTTSNSWRMLEDVPTPDSRGTFAHGAIHWFLSQGNKKQTVYSLDVKTEICREVLQPDYGEDIYKLTLGTLGNSLSVLCQYNTGDDLWVVQEYGVKECWKKVFTFPIPEDLTWKPRITPICSSLHGDFLLLVDLNVILYNPKKKDNQIKTLFEMKYNPSYNIFQELNVYNYVESLFSP